MKSAFIIHQWSQGTRSYAAPCDFSFHQFFTEFGLLSSKFFHQYTYTYLLYLYWNSFPVSLLPRIPSLWFGIISLNFKIPTSGTTYQPLLGESLLQTDFFLFYFSNRNSHLNYCNDNDSPVVLSCLLQEPVLTANKEPKTRFFSNMDNRMKIVYSFGWDKKFAS